MFVISIKYDLIKNNNLPDSEKGSESERGSEKERNSKKKEIENSTYNFISLIKLFSYIIQLATNI